MALKKPDPAPHGRDEAGIPLAPHGYNTDGTPRKSNRGRRATPSAAKPAATSVRSNLTDAKRKSLLVDLVDTLLATPLAAMSQAPAAVAKLGRHADALAGDAFIISHFAGPVADGLIVLSKTKPAALSWLDKTEENAPYLLLAQAGFQMAKALVENHMRPDPQLAKAGRNMVQIRMAQMAAVVNAEADRLARQAPAPAPDPVPADPDPAGYHDPTVQFAAA